MGGFAQRRPPRLQPREGHQGFSDSFLMVFEVKSVCKVEDVDRFGDKVALMRAQHSQQVVEGVIVTMAPLSEVEARCAEWGIRLVH